MERLKKIDADAYPQEALAEEEPRYLRRQKPVEIKRRKFGKKAWKTYFRVSLLVVAVAAAAGALFAAGDFLLTSPELVLASPSQVDLTGNHFVRRASVLEIFSVDRGRSVLRIPLARRRAELEALPWVERATVRRALPNRIEVDITERTPVAFLREGANLSLVDAEGVILDRPLEADFHFPVVTGINAEMLREDRARRMQMMVDFLNQVRQVRADAVDSVSEIDLSDPDDLQATIADLPGMVGAANSSAATDAVLVRFGNADFHDKFQVLLNNMAQWEAAAGRVASVDLRFEKEVVVNPENPAPPAQPLAKPAPVAHAVAPVHHAQSGRKAKAAAVKRTAKASHHAKPHEAR